MSWASFSVMLILQLAKETLNDAQNLKILRAHCLIKKYDAGFKHRRNRDTGGKRGHPDFLLTLEITERLNLLRVHAHVIKTWYKTIVSINLVVGFMSRLFDSHCRGRDRRIAVRVA